VGEGSAYPLEDGGYDLRGSAYELGAGDREVEVMFLVVVVACFEIFGEGFQVIEEGVVCLCRKVHSGEWIVDSEGAREGFEVFSEERGENCRVTYSDVRIEVGLVWIGRHWGWQGKLLLRLQCVYGLYSS